MNRKSKCNETITEFLTNMSFWISQNNKWITEIGKTVIIIDALTQDYYNAVTLMK